MGFLQRGFAWGNKRGFSVKQLPPDLFIRLISFILTRLVGGGGKAVKTETIIFDSVMGLGSYPDSLAWYLDLSPLTTSIDTLVGGGGKSVKSETFLTTSVVLSLGGL